MVFVLNLACKTLLRLKIVYLNTAFRRLMSLGVHQGSKRWQERWPELPVGLTLTLAQSYPFFNRS